MKKGSDKQRKFTLKERFNYWFDNRMTKGSLGLIRILIIVSVLFAVVMAGLIILFKFNDEGEIASVFWDSIATVINAWMPSYEDGSPGYLIIMSLTAIGGVLFTSVLIGIITSAIEEKIDNLKRGNSLVLEKDHIVVLGFYPGEYTLLNQLILAAEDEPACIVIAEDMEREDMEQNVMENLDIPKNVRIVCRTVDITDPASIEKCSVETCRTVIVSPSDDLKTIKAILAVSALLQKKGAPEISVNAIISKNEYKFPASLAEANNITTLQTNNILAKMIAHSCTQTGLSELFRDVFNFEGSEFYLEDLSGAEGLTFGEVMTRLNNAIPVGVCRDGKIVLNPSADYKLTGEDRILVYSENNDPAKLDNDNTYNTDQLKARIVINKETTSASILGHNETLPVILNELPENVTEVHIYEQNITNCERIELQAVADERNMTVNYHEEDPGSENVLRKAADLSEHIVILNDHDKDPEEADTDVIFMLLNLRDIRKRRGLRFNITVEMQKERNQNLVGLGDTTDFLVTSSMSSLILAQLAENPELIDVFREILSNEGNELYLKNAGSMQIAGTYTPRELRRSMIDQGYVLLGVMSGHEYKYFDHDLDEKIVLSEDDCLIVIGEE
ncbi:MAG: hypothetical protein J5879_06150 [Clostridia bacterium]|nr:hypothetical protein [Clostridia bacterium]